MFTGQMAGKGGFGTKRLGEENSGNIRVVVELKFNVVRSLVFHTAGPTVNMGGIGKKIK